MKNLPNRFPIRYALIAKYWEVGQDEGLHANWDTQKELLFRQFLSLLQEKPITEILFQLKATSLKISFFDLNLININHLDISDGWENKLDKKVKSLLPYDIELSHSSGTSVKPFNIALYSYRGGCEIPLFVKLHNHFSDKLELWKDTIEYFFNAYNDIKNLKGDEKVFELMTRFQKPVYLNLDYSPLWQSLDERFFEGFIPFNLSEKQKKEVIKKFQIDNGKIGKREKISVAICKDWKSIFAEEVIQLSKILSFCSNCGKALSFDYQGNYCPDMKENQQCVRERARIRAGKTRKKSQI